MACERQYFTSMSEEKRKTKESVSHILKAEGNLVMKDAEKSQVFKPFYFSFHE